MIKSIGIILIVLGALTIVFSEEILFPYISNIVGIETIVGKDNVIYDNPSDPNSSYCFTNPVAMIVWKAGIALCGLILLCFGLAIVFRNQIMSILKMLARKI